jgi:hypothetical protein
LESRKRCYLNDEVLIVKQRTTKLIFKEKCASEALKSVSASQTGVVQQWNMAKIEPALSPMAGCRTRRARWRIY